MWPSRFVAVFGGHETGVRDSRMTTERRYYVSEKVFTGFVINRINRSLFISRISQIEKDKL